MTKKKDMTRMNMEKDLAKLMEQIKKQDFKSDDELNDFMKNLSGQSLDELPNKNDKKSRSRDLVFDAYEESISKGKKLVKQALELDPNNADAYNYLAEIETDIDKALKQYEKAVESGEKTLGKKFLKEEKGYFWGILESRPYMRAKAGLADCLYAKNEINKAIEIYEEMLELNPNDNQGIRYILSTLLLEKKDLTKFENFIKTYPDEDSAAWNYNIALYNFIKSKQTIKSEKTLLQAYQSNKFVIDYMLGIKELPREQPEYIGLGDENEAVSYIYSAWTVWKETKGAFDWIYNFKQKRLKLN